MSVPPTALITMAGRGLRFRTAGYDRPKYAIEVHGRTLFAWAMESLRGFIDAGSPFVFITRREDAAGPFVATEAARMGLRSATVIELDATTDGQATTALLGEPGVADPAAPVFIYNIDTHVHATALPPSAVRGAGWIPCFPGGGTAWSFVRADASGRVVEVREKIRISDHATIGFYWFSSFHLYRETYERCFRRPGAGTGDQPGERYVAPMYNDLIARALPVYLHVVPEPAVVPLGTPAEVEAFARIHP